MFDGNGNWTSDFSAQADRDNGIKILASRFDNIFIADIKESFENCLTKDGQIAPIGNFNMGGQRITNLNNGVNDNDAVNMSQFNNAVHKTGDETISGTKTFQGTGWNLYIQNTNVTYNTAPSSDTTTAIAFVDKNSQNMGIIDCFRLTDNSTMMQFNIYGRSGAWARRPLEFKINSNGSEVAFAPASDAVSSIVTTEGINKDANGYVKLGNGITLQWGRYDNGVNSAGFKGTITLPTPFASTAYSFSLVGTRGNDEDITAAVNCEGRWKSTTAIGFQCSRTSGSSAGIRYIDWVAIGY